MGSASRASDFTSEAKFGLQWLNKMWNDEEETLYYQVGIGTDFVNNPNLLSDHDLWRLPQETIRWGHRSHAPVREASTGVRRWTGGVEDQPESGGTPGGRLRGMLASVQGNAAGIRGRLPGRSRHVFALADTSPAGELLTVAPFDFYGETEWRDDMELGATELYLALASADGPLPSALKHTEPQFYLRAAAHWRTRTSPDQTTRRIP